MKYTCICRKGFIFMQGQSEELKDIKDKVIEAVEKINDPDVLKLILNIFESRKKTDNENGRA